MQLPPLLSTAALVILPLIIFLRLLNKLHRPKRKLPPGPWKLPIIGSIHHLPLFAPTHHTFRNLARKYGPDLLHLRLGQVDLVVASSPAAATEILKTHDQIFAARPPMRTIKIIAYNSVGIGFSPYGPYWRQLRKICAHELFSAKRVRFFSFIRSEEARRLVESLRSAGGSPVNMSEIFLSLINTHITRASFGKECSSRQRFLSALKEMIKLMSLMQPADMFPSLSFVIGVVDGSRSRMKRVGREMDAVLDEIIAEHRQKKAGEGDAQEDLVDVLLRIQEKGDLQIPLAFENVKAVILDMLIGGTETTSVTLDWAMTELIRHPEAMRRAQLEVREALRGKTRIEESDINELCFLKSVIQETLRMHPPLPQLIPRICTKETEIFGFTIPAGSWVLVNVWAIGRDPEHWENPDSFCPDRFQGCALDSRVLNFEYIPFGAGRRICPGMAFATAGMEHYLAILLLHFHWELPRGSGAEVLDVDEQVGGSARRKNDLLLLATPYKPLENLSLTFPNLNP